MSFALLKEIAAKDVRVVVMSATIQHKETIQRLEEELAAVRKERDALNANLEHTAVRDDAELLRSQVWEAVSAHSESDPARDAELLEILHKKGDDFSEMKQRLQATMQQRAEESSMRERTALDMASRLDKFDSLLASNRHFLCGPGTEGVLPVRWLGSKKRTI